jgi:uncharacterized protein YfaT (DUF1175 family)
MLVPSQMRAPSKRFALTASVLILLLAALAWNFNHFFARTFEGAPASAKQEAGGGRQEAENITPAARTSTSSESKTIDSDNDGIPDFAELRTFEDRESFRRWFTAIAETQFYQLSPQWNKEQRDCAGLIRFAMREALRRHDRDWFQRMGPAYDSVTRDVKGFDLDNNELGEKIFRAEFGSFHDTDVRNGKFSEFADARSLRNFNAVFISRNRNEAQPGDLLFFYQPWVQKFPYHVMVFVGPARVAPNGARDWVVYHTGSTAADDGAVKKVELSVLDEHPDPRWRPVENNKNFLGFYRLKILQ